MAGGKSPTPQLTKGLISIYATPTRGLHQQTRIKKHKANNNSYSFFNFLTRAC